MMQRAMRILPLALACLSLSCAGSRVPETVEKQGKAREQFELIRQGYFDTADIPATREALADLGNDYLGHIPEETFTLLERLDQVQSLDLAMSGYARPFEDAECEGELLRLRQDLRRAGALATTSRGAEKVKLTRNQRQLQDVEARLQGCVARHAAFWDEGDRLLATSQDPAVLRPLVDRMDAQMLAEGELDEILSYLRRSQAVRHSQALIDKTDQLLLASPERSLIAAYLDSYADHSHAEALYLHLDRLNLEAEDWIAIENRLRRFPNQPQLAELESSLQAYYRQEFETGSRLFDEEKLAEAAGHLAAVAPRSPQYGSARALLREAESQGFYRWDMPEVWVRPQPYPW